MDRGPARVAGKEETVVRRFAPLIAGLVALTLVGGACSSKGGSSTADLAAAQAKIDQAAAKGPGALLRSTLDTILGEHVALLAEAGAAQVGGQEPATTGMAGMDAEAAKDDAKADAARVAAYSHMDMIGKAIAVAIRTQHPEKLAGTPDSKPSTLRAQLDAALQEHSVLLYNLGAAILQKNNAGATAAVDALNSNANDLAGIVGTQFAGSAQADFLA